MLLTGYHSGHTPINSNAKYWLQPGDVIFVPPLGSTVAVAGEVQRPAIYELRGGETVGAVLRSRRGVRPLYISIGHRVSLQTAIDYVLACTPRYRLPETTRTADRLASDK